ncbi:MAG: TetR/AcrR family transcriptional regulator [Nocardiaceae bacterium]|nr:TetR/AcrR family transcriptional regulator [Nocardiaceae bacterium]
MDLHVVGEEPAERGDAARNRQRLLVAANELLHSCGAESLTMDALAERAGVGKGTIFRRFGSRAGLMRALVNESEIDLQRRIVFGPPPLGPGADPISRLAAFGPAVLETLELHGDVILAGQTKPGARYSHPAYQFQLTHVLMLLRQAHAAGDHRLLAETLLATIDVALVRFQRTELDIPLDRLNAHWVWLVRATVQSPS